MCSESIDYYLASRPEIKFLLNHADEDDPIRVLEVGCGAGNFRKNFLSNNEYWGVEPHSDAALAASKVLDKVLVGTYSQVIDLLPDDYFECVVCCDVIEHMENPDFFLSSIKKKIRPNGYLVGSIPNVRYITNLYKLLFEKDWKYSESGTLDRTHLRFFTEKSLKRLFYDAGYEIDIFVGINPITISRRTWAYFFFTVISTIFCNLVWKDSKFFQLGFRIKPINTLNEL